MSAHRAQRCRVRSGRARHSRVSAGRPVSGMLVHVGAGVGGAVSSQTQRSVSQGSVFAVAAAAVVGAGAAAASTTGAFPALQAPPLLGLDDSQFSAQVIDAAAVTAPSPVAAAHPSPASDPASPVPGAAVMAGDLHHTDALQIAALSHAVSRSSSVVRLAPAGVPTARHDEGPVPGSEGVSLEHGPLGSGTLAGLAGLALPASIRGVPISGLAGTKTAALALSTAITKVGLPYAWGAAGPNAFDCSGLVLWAYKQLGINLPHSAEAQSAMGIPVSRADLRPGDLVFFYSPVSHEGIYLGNNKIFNAFDSGQPLKVSDMSRMPYHNARRL